MGFREKLPGTELLRRAIAQYEPGQRMTKEVYPALARAAGTTPAGVERTMRYAIEDAWLHGSMEAQRQVFGASINPAKGRPTVSEFIAAVWHFWGGEA